MSLAMSGLTSGAPCFHPPMFSKPWVGLLTLHLKYFQNGVFPIVTAIEDRVDNSCLGCVYMVLFCDVPLQALPSRPRLYSTHPTKSRSNYDLRTQWFWLHSPYSLQLCKALLVPFRLSFNSSVFMLISRGWNQVMCLNPEEELGTVPGT